MFGISIADFILTHSMGFLLYHRQSFGEYNTVYTEWAAPMFMAEQHYLHLSETVTLLYEASIDRFFFFSFFVTHIIVS